MVIVVCTGGEVPSDSVCGSWLDSGNGIVAADGGLGLLRRLGRKADLWIGDGDSLDGPLDGWSDWFQEARQLDRDKDETDTEAAVDAALNLGATEVWLLGGAGGRMDHWWANLRLMGRKSVITRWCTAHEETWVLRPGQTHSLGPGVTSVFPLGLGPWSVRSQGFRWPLDHVDFEVWHSLSNEVVQSAQLWVEQGSFLVMRPFGPGMIR